MGKKKFLNKKKSATFTLVYRDTGAEDDDAAIPVRQFTRVDGGDNYVPGFTDDDPALRPVDEYSDEEEKVDDRYDDADEESGDNGEEKEVQLSRSSNAIAQKKTASSSGLSENVRRELIELGFPDDGYDYNQHMRNMASTGFGAAFVPSTRATGPLHADVRAYDSSRVDVQPVYDMAAAAADDVIQLVSSGSRSVKKPVSKNGVLDDDIIAALEYSEGSHVDSADELEDEFVIFASEGLDEQASDLIDHGASTSGRSLERGSASQKQRLDEELADEEFDADELCELPEGIRKERPTRLLDEQFEMLALREYDDLDDGELDEDDPFARGHADIAQFSSVLSEFLNEKDIYLEKYETIVEAPKVPTAQESLSMQGDRDSTGGKAANTNMIVQKGVENSLVKKTLELGGYESEGEVVGSVKSDKGGDEWDCDTVVSTYSNLDNHPAKISAPGRSKPIPKFQDLEKTKIIRLSGKQHLPSEYLPGKVLEDKECGKRGHKEAISSGKVAGPRAGETPGEKKARKASIKENRREARLAKKTMKLCYREESQRAQHGAATMGPNVIHLP